jgi:hypothetical protein
LNYAVLDKKMNQLDNVIEAIEDRTTIYTEPILTPLQYRRRTKVWI